MVALTGPVFEITTADELVVALEVVQVVFVANSWQIIESPFTNPPEYVDVVTPVVAPFLYQSQVRPAMFSVSESKSENAPALQVKIEVMYAGFGVMLGAPKEAAWSG